MKHIYARYANCSTLFRQNYLYTVNVGKLISNADASLTEDLVFGFRRHILTTTAPNAFSSCDL